MKLSMPMNLLTILAGFVLTTLAVLFLIFVYMEGRGRDREVIPFLMIPAMLPSLLSGFLIMRAVYKLWMVIQSGNARTSPEMAIALLFIPFFNFYWVFVSYWGLAKDYNSFARDKNLPLPVLSESLALAVCILILLSLIPLLGFVFFLINIVLQVIFVASIIQCHNRLVDVRKAAQS